MRCASGVSNGATQADGIDGGRGVRPSPTGCTVGVTSRSSHGGAEAARSRVEPGSDVCRWSDTPRLSQRRLLIEAVHAVEVLHGHAAGAAEKVVFAGEDEDAAADDADGEIEKVGAAAILRGGQVLDDADERGRGVIGP